MLLMSLLNLGQSSNAFTSSVIQLIYFQRQQMKMIVLNFTRFCTKSKYYRRKVEKEKGIICQEIKMYDDDPDWRVYFGAIANFYHNILLRLILLELVKLLIIRIKICWNFVIKLFIIHII